MGNGFRTKDKYQVSSIRYQVSGLKGFRPGRCSKDGEQRVESSGGAKIFIEEKQAPMTPHRSLKNPPG